MNVTEAKEKIRQYYIHYLDMNEEDKFVLDELCRYVYEQTGDINYLLEGFDFNGDPKYLEKICLYAVECGDEHTAYLLGKLYESGRLGKPDYAKAYEYYLRASKTKPIGDGTFDNSYRSVHNDAKIKLARMYKYGIFVKKDMSMYKRLINEAYEDIREQDWKSIRYETLFAKAKLELEEGNIEEGIEILYLAREEYWRLLEYMQLRSDYELLDEMNSCLYRYQEIDYTEAEPEDITELLKESITISFKYNDSLYKIRSYEEDGDIVIEFEGNLYRDPIDFIMKAKAGDTWFKEMLFNSDMWEVKR